MPDNHNEELDTYTIPPNFMESGTLFGGAFKLRNALEAGAIVLAVGLPVFSGHPCAMRGHQKGCKKFFKGRTKP